MAQSEKKSRRRLPARWRDLIVGILLVCAVATVAQMARRTDPVSNLEWELYSRFSKARDISKYAKQIAIVEVDDDAYSTFVYKIPTPRDYLAKLITTICKNSKPKAIGLDFLLDSELENGRWAEDAALEDALRTAKESGVQVVLGCEIEPSNGEDANMPLDRFRKYSLLGNIDVRKGGAESELRSIDWFDTYKGKDIPAFSGVLAALEDGANPKHIDDWIRDRVAARGRYAGFIEYNPGAQFAFEMPSGFIAHNPWWDQFNGKIVLIGANSKFADDNHPTPMQNGAFKKGIMPGTYVQAYAAMTLLAPTLTAPSPKIEWLLSAVSAALFLTLLYRFNAAKAFAVGGGVLLIGVVGALYVFARTGNTLVWMGLLNVGPSMIAVFACALGWWIRRQVYLYSCFGTFFSKPVLRGISSVNDLSEVKPTTGTATVMFCDLIGFSKVCRRLTPEQALTMANHYLNPIGAVVERQGGLLEKFTGDGCLAYFGAPLPGEAKIEGHVSALRAAKAGLEIQQEMERLRTEARALGMAELQMSVGLHTGPLSAGLVGARPRVQFTVIGDTVNDAARVESFGHLSSYEKPLTTRVMASEATARELTGRAVVEEKINAHTDKYSGRIYEVEAILNGKA